MRPGLLGRLSRMVSLIHSFCSRSTVSLECIILTAYQSILIGRDNDFDVVLIDTAGRMQDNEVSVVVTTASTISPLRSEQ